MRKISYQSYETGYDKRELRLGNLAFDFVYPQTKEPHIHRELTNTELEELTTSDQRPWCYLASRGTDSISFGLGLQDLLDFHKSSSRASYTAIVGKDGSQVKLLRPEKFFRENILADDEARLWLIKRLTVVRKLHSFQKFVGIQPKIWLLIGLYYISDAVTCHVASDDSKFGAKASVPIDPSGLSSLLQLNVGVHADFGGGMVVERGSQISGQKVWAALWQRVDAKYLTSAAGSDVAINELSLLDIYSSERVSYRRSVRGAKKDEVKAEVSLAEDGDEPDENEETVPDDFWSEMNKELEFIEEEYFGE